MAFRELPNERIRFYRQGLAMVKEILSISEPIDTLDLDRAQTLWTQILEAVNKWQYPPPSWLRGAHRESRYPKLGGEILSISAAQRLRHIRIARQETIRQTATACDVHYSTLGNVERRQVVCAPTLLEKLAAHFAVTVAWITNGEDTSHE